MSWKNGFSNGPGRKSCCSASAKLLSKHSRGCAPSRDSTQRNVGPNLHPGERAREREPGDSAAFLRVELRGWILCILAPGGNSGSSLGVDVETAFVGPPPWAPAEAHCPAPAATQRVQSRAGGNQELEGLTGSRGAGSEVEPGSSRGFLGGGAAASSPQKDL